MVATLPFVVDAPAASNLELAKLVADSVVATGMIVVLTLLLRSQRQQAKDFIAINDKIVTVLGGKIDTFAANEIETHVKIEAIASSVDELRSLRSQTGRADTGVLIGVGYVVLVTVLQLVMFSWLLGVMRVQREAIVELERTKADLEAVREAGRKWVATMESKYPEWEWAPYFPRNLPPSEDAAGK